MEMQENLIPRDPFPKLLVASPRPLLGLSRAQRERTAQVVERLGLA